jgi:sulfotransferase
MKNYYFMAGLPRSGSTLLKSILEQNPNVHASPISPVMELMYWTEDYFKRSEQYQAYPKPNIAHNIIKGMMDQFYMDVNKPIIIDHCRAWPNNVERIKTYLTSNPKIICPVRDVADILASFIAMIHRNKDQISFIDKHLIDHGIPVNDDTRCEHLMSDVGIVEQSLWAQYQAFVKNDTKYMLFVEYEDLIYKQEETMRKIYDFLEVDPYSHDFNNVHNNHREMDTEVWNLKDMHYVRKEVKKISKRPEDVLSPYILNKYKKLEYWKYPDSLYLKNGN